MRIQRIIQSELVAAGIEVNRQNVRDVINGAKRYVVHGREAVVISICELFPGAYDYDCPDEEE